VIRKRRAAALSKKAAESKEGESPENEIVEQNIQSAFLKNPKSVESGFWIIFVILFSFVATLAQGNDGYAYKITSEIRSLYAEFTTISKFNNWWDFMSEDFLNTMYQDTWYNGDNISSSDVGLVNFQFLVVGPVYTRQLRVRNDSCKSRYEFNATSRPLCFADFSSTTEDRNPYGPLDNTSGLPSYVYRSSEQLGCMAGCYTSGFVGMYPVSGFLEMLPTPLGNASRDAAAERLKELKDGRWIDRGTRVIFVEFSL
jgi:hypothetical protein